MAPFLSTFLSELGHCKLGAHVRHDDACLPGLWKRDLYRRVVGAVSIVVRGLQILRPSNSREFFGAVFFFLSSRLNGDVQDFACPP